MGWLGDDVPSGRSRDDLLSGVVKRGHFLQLRRRLVTAGATLAAMVLVLPAGVLAVRDDGGTTQVASEAPASTTTSAPVTTLVSGTEGVAAENPAADPPPAPSSSVPPTTLTAPVTTTARTVPSSTTSTPVGSLPLCATAKLAANAQSGQPVYQWYETVTANGFVSNDSRTPCRYSSYTLRFEVRLGATTVFSATSVVHAGGNTVLGVGQVLVAAPADWSRRTCNGSELCPSGDYMAVFGWSFDGGPMVEARAPFLVTPAPTTTTSTPE